MTDDQIRPLLFVRIRLYRGGMAEWVRDVLRDEQEALYEDLGRLRGKGLPEDDPEVEDVRNKLLWSVNVLRDIDSGLVSLVGPDPEGAPEPPDGAAAMTLTGESFFDWETAQFFDVVPFPERYVDVIADKAYWEGAEIEYVGPQDAGGVRWVRDWEVAPDLGEGSWRRHDPAHPRCWYCGKFTSPRCRGVFVPPCRDCGESVGGPW